MIASSDPFLLAALNSPLLWWFGWRHFAHMKDEALTPAGYKMELLPIARPNQQQSERAADLTERLAATHRARHEATRALGDWLRVEWGLANPPGALGAPFAMSADAFADALRKALPKQKKLSPADIAAIKKAHADTVAPVATRLNEAAILERELSAVVNAAYGITPEEEALIWRTAPPRMPIPPPVMGQACAGAAPADLSGPSGLSSRPAKTGGKVKRVRQQKKDPPVPGADARFAEFSEVTLKRPVEVQGVQMPAGAHGVIMGVYADGLAYEVEFASPHVVLTIEQEDLQA